MTKRRPHRRTTRRRLHARLPTVNPRQGLRVAISLGLLVVGIFALTGSKVYAEPQLLPSTETLVDLDSTLELHFSHPIDRTGLVPQIEPSVPGAWQYGDFLLLGRHLPRSLRFTPAQSLTPTTTYRITLETLHGYAGGTQFITADFQTNPLSTITDVTPLDGATIATNQTVVAQLSHPARVGSRWELQTEPGALWKVAQSDGTTLIFTPVEPLARGTSYTARLLRRTVTEDLATGEIIRGGDLELVWHGLWMLAPPPGLAGLVPQGDQVTPNEPLRIGFTTVMDQADVLARITLEPTVSGSWSWPDPQTLQFLPAPGWATGTTYRLHIPAATKSADGETLAIAIGHDFTTIGAVRITATRPSHGSRGVTGATPLVITANQPLTGNANPTIEPATPGTTTVDGSRIIFTPGSDWPVNTTYTVIIAAGLTGQFGTLAADHRFTFTTVYTTTALPVPLYYQERPLSCEAAALRMALAGKGVLVSEQTILDTVGFDPTPHAGGVWGNPHLAFVGDVDGHQMSTGYGVYWEPIARAGNHWRPSEATTGGTIDQLISEIDAGNPIITWGYYGSGAGMTWQTPDGTEIYAVKGEHTRTIYGYVGPRDHPQWLLVHDPLAGSQRWRPDQFLHNWNSLGRSGVIVR